MCSDEKKYIYVDRKYYQTIYENKHMDKTPVTCFNDYTGSDDLNSEKFGNIIEC